MVFFFFYAGLLRQDDTGCPPWQQAHLWVNLHSFPYRHEPLFLLKRMQWSGLDRFAGAMHSFVVGGNRGREDEELGEGE